MAKTRPEKKSKSRKKKGILNTVSANPSSSRVPSFESPRELLQKAAALLQISQPDEALTIARKALSLLRDSGSPTAPVPALELIGQILLELGELDTARKQFEKAAQLDADGKLPESEGGGPEKFLWLAQLCEDGGHESIKWFEKGASVLRSQIGELESRASTEEAEDKKRRLANVLCGMAEVYMTDLALEADAEQRCEKYVTEALLVSNNNPESLQTLASIRISQLRRKDAQMALSQSYEQWKNLDPEDPLVPDFATRVSLTRLLLEAELENEALEVVERLIQEDDQSVEVWYLGGWALYLMAEKQRKANEDAMTETAEDETVLWASSRSWLRQSLKLYVALDYEDERLRDHAKEIVQQLNERLGDAEESAGSDQEGEWTDDSDDESDDEMDEA